MKQKCKSKLNARTSLMLGIGFVCSFIVSAITMLIMTQMPYHHLLVFSPNLLFGMIFIGSGILKWKKEKRK